MSMTGIITCKIQNLYLAYSPGSGASSWGGCLEEAANSLADELRLAEDGQTGDERTANAVI